MLPVGLPSAVSRKLIWLGETLPSVVSPLLMDTMALGAGWAERRTVKVAAPPSSLVGPRPLLQLLDTMMPVAATVIWNCAVAVRPWESVAVQVYWVRALAAPGVPVTWRVAALRLTPSGRAGERV